jgi:hypothetical protein
MGERKKEKNTRARSPRRVKGARTRCACEWSAKNPVQCLRERGFFLHICFATSNFTDITRGILRLVTDLIFGTLKTVMFPSYKYARVPDTERTTRLTPQPACCSAAYATSSRSSACTGDRESRSPEPHPQRTCTGRERIRFLGNALRDCSNAFTSPSSTSSSPRLVFLLVSGARLGVSSARRC